ncbi:MAG TPA: carbohydrate kinase family protein [Candidatus Sulfotelmatobacter sp.]|jgi:sugar/nucleoside kinase (ribokinase family)|nr:carbohydrate kinase family protein [Candidatus Sulfotelmatobacter sp.]
MPRFDVTVAGELNLDLILYGLPEQLLPERELLADRMMLTLGSSSAIVAHNLAALGGRVGFQSRIGDDPLGRIALERLQQGNVDVSNVRVTPGATTTGLTVILHHEVWRNILTYAGTIAELTWDDLDLDYLADSRHFHLSSYYLQRALQPRVAELFRSMKSKGLTVSLDTNDDPEDKWEGGLSEVLKFVDVFLPNEREACKAAGTEDPEEAIGRLSKLVPLVVVKLGRQGALAQRGAERVTSPSKEVVAIDTVGAGDSFDAGFLHEYVRGSDLPTCLASGNLAGALSTTRPGGTEAFRDSPYRDNFIHERRAELLGTNLE